jgi:hypothetical protein
MAPTFQNTFVNWVCLELIFASLFQFAFFGTEETGGYEMKVSWLVLCRLLHAFSNMQAHRQPFSRYSLAILYTFAGFKTRAMGNSRFDRQVW